MLVILKLALFTISLTSCLASEMDEFEDHLDVKQKQKINILKSFCHNKTENFCSPISFSYMSKVMKLEREQNMKDHMNKKEEERIQNKIIVENVKQEIRNAKLTKFVKVYPTFKILMDYLPDRFFRRK
jgi:hypothetical protein